MDAHNSMVARPFRAFLLVDCLSPGRVPRAGIESPRWGSSEFSVWSQVHGKGAPPKTDANLDREPWMGGFSFS